MVNVAIDSTTPSLDDPADTAERFDDDSGDSLDLGPVDRISERPADAAPEYLDGDSALDPILERTPLAELYPERFTPTTADQQAALEGAYEADHRPEAWISEAPSRAAPNSPARAWSLRRATVGTRR